MPTQTTQPPSPVARRLALAILGIILLAILGGAGWSIASRIGRPPDYELFEVMPPAATAYQIGRALAANAANNPNFKQIRGGDFLLTANKSNGQWSLRLNFTNRNLLPPDQEAALRAASRLSVDAAFAKSLNVTDDQVKQLKQIPRGMTLIFADADRAAVHKAWDAYIASPQPAAQSALEHAVQQAGQNSLEPTRKVLSERALKVQSILTSRQIAPFAQ
jgi:hypothetical protein